MFNIVCITIHTNSSNNTNKTHPTIKKSSVCGQKGDEKVALLHWLGNKAKSDKNNYLKQGHIINIIIKHTLITRLIHILSIYNNQWHSWEHQHKAVPIQANVPI